MLLFADGGAHQQLQQRHRDGHVHAWGCNADPIQLVHRPLRARCRTAAVCRVLKQRAAACCPILHERHYAGAVNVDGFIGWIEEM